MPRHKISPAIIGGLMLIGTTFALSGCGTKVNHAVTTSHKVPVSVQIIRMQTIPQTLSFNGTITPYVQTSLSAATSGLLSQVLVRPGQFIHAGEVVAQLDSSQNVPQANALQQATASASTAKINYQNSKTAQASSLAQALAAEKAAQTSYQNAKMLANDRTTSQSQVVTAQNALAEAKAGVQVADANLQKAQLQQNSLLNGGGTGQDLISLETIANEDQQALKTANDSLTVAQQNESLLKNQLAQDQTLYGTITTAQVQQAYQNYQTALSNYNQWQNGAFAGQNPYTTQLNSLSTVYTFDNTGYNTLQATEQQYNMAVQAVNQGQSQVSTANAALAAAQKNLTDANPPTTSNAAAQANSLVSVAQAARSQAEAQYQAAQRSLTMANQMYNDRTQAQTQMNSAYAALNQAMINVNSIKAQTQTQINSAVAALHQAVVNESSAQSALMLQTKDDHIISPIAGKVVTVSAQAGQTVDPQIPILTVASTSPVIATINVPEADIRYVSVGSKISVNLPALVQTLPGQVIDIRPQPDPTTNEYQVDVKILTNNPNILAGMQVQGTMHLSTGAKGIYVPAQSVLILSDGGDEVFLVKKGMAYSQFVQIGNMTATQYAITEGLQPGDVLVTAGQNYLSNGDRVQIQSNASSTQKNHRGTHS